MRSGDTIVAVASPPGRSLRALVRVSGPGAPVALARLGAGGSGTWARGCSAERLEIGGPARLPALVARLCAPASYTGEHVAEIGAPGSPVVVERLVASILGAGDACHPVRPAQPGEFSLRAFLNGRISIEQAEGVALTIGARTRAELGAARALVSGEAGARWRALGEELATLLALVEAGVDFTDQEDVRPIEPAALGVRLERVRVALDAQLAGAGAVRRPDHRPVVVLAGAPNAGKSTLFNALLGRRRAVVSPAPGATRDVIREELDLSGGLRAAPGSQVVVTLTDLAGLDAALAERSAIDADAQRRAREEVERADVVVWCDPTGRFRDAGAGRAALRVQTMADLPGAGAARSAMSVCALDGAGLGALRRAIADAAAGASSGGELTLLARHAHALRATLAHVESGAGLVATRGLASPELVGAELRLALDALGEITGRVPPDDVIGRIFASFCVGK